MMKGHFFRKSFCLGSSFPDSPFGHLQGEGGRSTEGEKWADQDPGGGTGLDHFPPEKGPLSGWSESPSSTFVE